MIDKTLFDDLAARLTAALPDSMRDARDELQQNFRSILQSTFNRFDLVTRDEFDAQTKVLERTRSKLEQLERKLSELEQAQPK